MVSVVYSAGLNCLEGYLVQVEADLSSGLPSMELVGYLSSEVKEARERVRTALKNAGCVIPLSRITINLSPANVRKSGTGFDLAMAVSILKSMRVIDDEATRDAMFLGELNLSGELCAINGVLPRVLLARKLGIKKCFLPKDNVNEGAFVEGMEIYGASDLISVISHLIGTTPIEKTMGKGVARNNPLSFADENDLKFVQGQALAKRGLEVAVSGMHNMIMMGPPGAGKSMLAKCIPSILPPLSETEILEVSSIYSISGKLNDNMLITRRPFINPHHTVTDTALAGGGLHPRPGLFALAHKGVLFLDEMPEFRRSSLEILRQPLEDKKILISRNGGNYIYPSDFMLVGAMNPCPCGNYPNMNRCHCTDAMREKYLSKISGPLLDRIDVCLITDKVDPKDIINKKEEESSESVRKRVMAASEIQNERFRGSKISFNSQMNNEQIEKYCRLKEKETTLLSKLMEKNDISARGYFRILKLSRTIADLEESEDINENHILEAVRLKLNFR